MKFEEYHRRLMAEKIDRNNGDDGRNPFPNNTCSRKIEEAINKIDSISKRLALAEDSFYRKHWWQFWRPSKSNSNAQAGGSSKTRS